MLALTRLPPPVGRSQYQNHGPTEMSRIELFALLLRKSEFHHIYLQDICNVLYKKPILDVSFMEYHVTREMEERSEPFCD